MTPQLNISGAYTFPGVKSVEPAANARPVTLYQLQAGGNAAEEFDRPFIKGDLYEEVKLLLRRHVGFWLYGPAGTGKSSIVQYACNELKFGFYRINLNGHSTDEVFTGQYRLKVDENSKQPFMEYVTGQLVKAMLHGLDENGEVVGPPGKLLIDEIGSAPPETLFTIQRVLEPSKTLALESDGGRIIKAHPLFSIVAADNTMGTGDLYGGYVGTEPVNFATRDRFPYMLEVPYNEEIERKIVLNIFSNNGKDAITKDMTVRVDKMQSLVRDIRETVKNGQIFMAMSIRRLCAWAEAIDIYNGDVGKAFIRSVSGFLEPDQANVLNELFQRTMGKFPSQWSESK